MKYLVIDEQHRIFQTKIFYLDLKQSCYRGDVSIVKLKKMEGLNLDGSWSEIQEWKPGFQPDPRPENKDENSNSAAVDFLRWLKPRLSEPDYDFNSNQRNTLCSEIDSIIGIPALPAEKQQTKVTKQPIVGCSGEHGISAVQ